MKSPAFTIPYAYLTKHTDLI